MAKGTGGGEGNICPGILWSVFWFFATILVGWPIGFLVAWFYVFLLPFSACSLKLRIFCEMVLRAVKLPFTFAENMVKMKSCC